MGVFLFDAVDGGFTDTNTNLWLMFDEYLTETENHLSLIDLHNNSGVDYYSGVEAGYSSALLYFDFLLTDLSNRINVPIDQLVIYFLRCRILGDKQCLKLFDIGYGEGTSKLLSEADKIAYCTRLGLPVETLRERIRQYSNGEPIAMATWDGYEIQMPPD